MIIRKTTLADREALIALMEEFNSYYYEKKIFSEAFKPFWQYKDIRAILNQTAQEWLTDPQYFLFVAEEQATLIGYICGHIRSRLPRVLDKEGYIDDWFVTKSWRGKGVGTKLYNQILTEFKKAGCNRLGLLTNSNNKETIQFYHKLGFIDESLTMVKKLD